MVKIRVVFFRRYYDGKRGGDNAELELDEVCNRFESNIVGADIRFKRMGGEAFYYWMLFWFNPRPDIAEGRIGGLRNICPYPGDDDLPLGTDLSELLCLKPPLADASKGYLYFDGSTPCDIAGREPDPQAQSGAVDRRERLRRFFHVR